MTLSKLSLLQKAARNICTDPCFRNQWVPLYLIEIGMKSRYKFNESYPLSKTTPSKALGKIDPMIDSLDVNINLVFIAQRWVMK